MVGVRRRTRWIILSLSAVALLLGALSWLGVSRAKDFQAAAMQGKDEASVAVASLEAKNATAAAEQFDKAAASFRTARDLLGPDWAVAAMRALPWLGSQVGAADDLATIGLEGSVAGREVAAMLRDAPPATDGSAGLGSMLTAARPHLDAALVALTNVADRSTALTDQGLVAPLADAVRQARQVLSPMAPVLHRSHALLDLERYFLSAPRRILLLAQNNAEIRPTGGFIGSYGLIEVGPNGLKLEKYDDIYALGDQPRATQLPVPEGATMGGIYFKFRDANWWIDYPTSARMLQRFWGDLGQEPVDGIVAVDVVAMRDLLEVFGPIRIDEFNTTFSFGNLLEKLISIVEVQMGPTGQPRKGVLVLLANELTRRMLDMRAEDLLRTSTVLGHSAEGKHVQLYFTDAQLQASVNDAGWAGAIDTPDGTTDLLAVSNAMIRASKANMGVRKSIGYVVNLHTDGSAETTLTLGYSNTDPQVPGILRRWFGNYLRVYRPVGTVPVAGVGEATATPLVTDGLGLPAVARAFRVYRGQERLEIIRTNVPNAVGSGRAAVLPLSPLALGTEPPPTAPADRVSHYRLLVVRQADLEDVPTTVTVNVPSGATVSRAAAWARNTGVAVPVTVQGHLVSLSTPLDGDLILDVELQR